MGLASRGMQLSFNVFRILLTLQKKKKRKKKQTVTASLLKDNGRCLPERCCTCAISRLIFWRKRNCWIQKLLFHIMPLIWTVIMKFLLMSSNKNSYDIIIIIGRYSERSLMAWVVVIPKEEWARVAAPILLLVPLPELLDFLPQEKRQIPRSATFPRPGNLLWISLAGKIANITIARFPLGNQLKVSNRKTMCQNFLVGNLLKISLAFPLDFLAGKPKNTGSVRHRLFRFFIYFLNGH